MSLILFVVFGFAIGLLARAVLSGGQKLGTLMTIWLGIAGSLIGGLLMSFVSVQRVTEFHAAGVLGSIIGAFVILASGGAFRRTAVA